MKPTKLIAPIIVSYVVGMLCFWLSDTGAFGWTVFFYSWEKLFAASGFFLLAITSHSRLVINCSIYAVSVCLYMLIYYILCYFVDHSIGLGVAAFLMYSIIILYLLYKNTKR